MPSALPRKSWLLLLPALLMLGVAGYRMGVGANAPAPDAMGGMRGAVPQAPAALAPSVELLPMRERSSAIPAGLPVDLRAALEGEGDLYPYSQRLLLAADAGNAEARWMVSRIYDYCAVYAMDPAGFSLDTVTLQQLGEAAPGLQGARETVRHRCGGFVASDGLGHARILSLRQQAAHDGNLAAEASLLAMSEPLQPTAEYRRDLVERVLRSQDPEAFLALSPAMGTRAAGDDAYRGIPAGTQLDELAWQMAACELGLACGPDSVLMNSYCANGGICARDPLQDFDEFVYDAAVSRQGAEKMKNVISRLLRPAEAQAQAYAQGEWR